jgi:hypothetical protein
MFIINAPFMFKMAYSMFSGLMDETTKSRIHILKKPTDLLEHIEASQLPKEYGGLIEYTKEQPIFTRPFATAEGHSSQYDDVFTNLLEKRRARLAAKQATQTETPAAAPAEGADATSTTTTTTSTTTTTTEAAAATPSADAPAEEAPKEAASPAPAAEEPVAAAAQ